MEQKADEALGKAPGRPASPGPSDRKFISVEDAGRELGVKRARAYELVHSGHLPHVRMGKRILVPVQALDRLAEEAIEKAAGKAIDNETA